MMHYRFINSEKNSQINKLVLSSSAKIIHKEFNVSDITCNLKAIINVEDRYCSIFSD